MSNFQSVATSGLWKKRNLAIESLINLNILDLELNNLKAVPFFLSLETDVKSWSCQGYIARKNSTWRLSISNVIGDNVGRVLELSTTASKLNLNIENLELIQMRAAIVYTEIK